MGLDHCIGSHRIDHYMKEELKRHIKNCTHQFCFQ